MKKKLGVVSFCVVVVLSAHVSCWAAANNDGDGGGRKRSGSLSSFFGKHLSGGGQKSPSSSPKGSPRGSALSPLQKALDDLRILEQEITLKFSFAHLYVTSESMINGNVFEQIHDLLTRLVSCEVVDELVRKPLCLRIMKLYEKAYKGHLKHLGYLKYSIASSEQPINEHVQESFQILFNGWLGEGVMDVTLFFQSMRDSLEQIKATKIADA
ncbi:hypothetical protein K2X40_00975 [Candidatus Babeliales bacterium]|nr:hypothetical protein [Candidatus Babeliales bacterium]